MLSEVNVLVAMQPLAAVWLRKPMTLADGSTTHRLCPGMELSVEGNSFVISECLGSITGAEFFLVLRQGHLTYTLKIE